MKVRAAVAWDAGAAIADSLAGTTIKPVLTSGRYGNLSLVLGAVAQPVRAADS